MAADGRLFFSSANAGYGPASVAARRPGLWDLQTNSYQAVLGLPQPELNETAATVMLPPAQRQRIMIFGGGGVGDVQTATARTAIVDLSVPEPRWVRGPDMSVAKRYPGAVVLPDDTVFVSGVSRGYRARDSRTAEIFDVATGSFTPAAPPHVGRDYHSEYMLLPDGRVAAFGSNPLSDDNFFETRVEVYSPPYLFRGPRPAIRAVSRKITRGQRVEIAVTAHIATVRLLRPSSYTHVTDNEQRSVACDIAVQQNNTVTVEVPVNPNLLPPDWYMLFVVDSDGVPSTAAWVRVG